MNIIASLASNPLPTSIAVVIAIAALLGYYFFVIPLMDEHKILKEKAVQLENTLETMRGGADTRFHTELVSIEASLAALREILSDGALDRTEKFKQLEAFVASVGTYQDSDRHLSSSLQNQIDEISRNLQKIGEVTQTTAAGSRVREESVDRLLTEVNRNMQHINEKQSQILGALLGMGRIQDRNKGI